MNIITWRTIIWQQFEAVIDMLGDAIKFCADHLWTAVLWDEPDNAEYGQFSFVAYHALFCCMRHVQEHAAHLSFLLTQHGVTGFDWVTQARNITSSDCASLQ
ncbi:MAG: hypothetical protein IPM39_12565 [Chloroflexi bacterium]|nr:hypothetical protein [Chloroflexota bacterium]